jgi:hypothetical protein
MSDGTFTLLKEPSMTSLNETFVKFNGEILTYPKTSSTWWDIISMLFSIKSMRLVIVESSIFESDGDCFINSRDIFITDRGFLKSCVSRPDNSPMADNRSDFNALRISGVFPVHSFETNICQAVPERNIGWGYART